MADIETLTQRAEVFLASEHRIDPESWRSCPKSNANPEASEDWLCDCGKDVTDALIRDLLAALTAEATARQEAESKLADAWDTIDDIEADR